MYDKNIVVPLEKSIWRKLRMLSFDNDCSMNSLVRTAINRYIKHLDKKKETKDA